MLDARHERATTVRRESLVDIPREPIHAEQHVDRHDENQHCVEERASDRDCSTLEEADDAMGVLADIPVANALDEPVPTLLNPDRAQMMVVEPLLETVDIAIGRNLAAPSVR